jgi:hypothetical protein
MIHAQIDLPADIYEDVERIAKARRKPTAQVIRDLVGVGVANWRQAHRSRRRSSEAHGLGQLANLGLQGPKDMAIRLDDYLYGDA